ncbi:hypothetical protein BGX26_005675, partial [Mortierella sp. AD094]
AEEGRISHDYTPLPQVPHVIATNANFEGSAFWKMLGMESTWTTKGGVDILMSFEDAKEAILGVSPDITLCQDNVADFCHSSELQDSMNDKACCLALDSLPIMPYLPAMQSKLPHHIFGGDVSWKEISDRVDDLMEKVPNPVPALNRYIFTAFYPLDYVVELLRDALSVYGIPYAWREVYVPAVAYRKGNELTGTGRGKFADGVPEEQGDKLKLKRMLRDLLNYTILEMAKSRNRVSLGLTVFGSQTFKDTTELIGMDYKGVYRTYCLETFKVVTEAEDAKTLLECFEMCLRFAITVKNQIGE